MLSSNISEPVRVGDYISIMSNITGQTPGSSVPMLCYIHVDVYYRSILTDKTLTDMALLRYADYVVDLNNNNLIKCRTPLVDLIDSFITRKITNDVHC